MMTIESIEFQSEPEESIHFEEIHVEPWPDGQRVRVHITLSPFTTRPNLEAVLCSLEGDELQRINIVENMDSRLVFTMHLRGASLPGRFRLTTIVYFDPEKILDQKSIEFEISQPAK